MPVELRIEAHARDQRDDIAQLLSDGQILTIYYDPFAFLGNGFLFGLPFSLFVVALVFVGLKLLLERSALGLFVRAIGHNPVAAHVAGVRARAITWAAYVFCGFSAGLAGSRFGTTLWLIAKSWLSATALSKNCTWPAASR